MKFSTATSVYGGLESCAEASIAGTTATTLLCRGPFSTCSPFTMSFMTERDFRYNLLWGSLKKNGRRKSLKTLFQLPLSARASNYGTLSTTASVGSIPADIVREIVDLMSASDILSFSLTVCCLLSSFMPDTEVLANVVKANAGSPPSSSV